MSITEASPSNCPNISGQIVVSGSNLPLDDIEGLEHDLSELTDGLLHPLQLFVEDSEVCFFEDTPDKKFVEHARKEADTINSRNPRHKVGWTACHSESAISSNYMREQGPET